MKTMGAIVAAVLLLGSAGCGSSRPSSADVSKALQDGVKSSKTSTDQTLKLKKTQADCVAKVFVGSTLTDSTLTSMVDKHTYPQSKANDKILSGLATKLSKCQAS